MTYRETAERMKHAISDKFRRTALLGGAAVVLTGVVAGPAMAASAHSANPAQTTAAVVQEHAAPAANKSAPKHAAPKQAAPAAKKPAKKAVKKAPAMRELSPRSITARQTTYKPSAEQMRNARKIIAAGQKRHLPARAWVVALATSSQETNLHNYGNLGHLNDHDSLGLFQQRPSSGWGRPSQLVNPDYAAGKFYGALTHVHNWKNLPVTVAAQDVQVSAFGDRYAQWEKQAVDLILATYGQGPYAHVSGATS